MAVTANQLTVRADGCKVGFPAKASTHLYQGTLAFLDSGGYLDDDTATGVNTFAGVNIDDVDNSSGSSGDLNADVWREGEFLLTGASFDQGTVGLRIYATDNYTITKTNSASAVYIGICTGYVSSTKVYVTLDCGGTEGVVTDSVTTQVVVFDGATGVNEVRVPTNLVDALSLESSAGDIFTVDTSTGAVVFNFSADVRVNVLGSAQIGNATTDLVAFHGSTPTDQCAAYTQTYATADRTHANPTAIAAALTATNPTAITEYTPHASGGTTVTSNGATDLDTTAAALNTLVDECQALEIIVSADIADMVTQKAIIDAVIVDLADLKQLVNSIIDDLQEKGLVG